ncbi:hypothetical protein CC2G_003959 [Coprinopsis cinerea AmutBmut pab1-1]|nr:hypothetical protein CC2G_003959 [Coprinopsis cinerea AmutBmut pab1-1]
MEPGRYRVINVKGGTALDLDINNNSTVHGWAFHGGDNQLWDFEHIGDNIWTICNANTGGYLAIVNGIAGDGVKAVSWADPFEWAVWPDENDGSVWRIGVPDTAFHLDLSDHGNSADGTAVQVWNASDGRNQCWVVEEA